MVHSPVGARCIDCASIGRAPIFRATPVELATTIALSVVAAILFGIAYGIVVWILWPLPLGTIGFVASALVIGLAGAPVGDFVRKAGKYKLDARLRIVAALSMFIVWSVGLIVASMLHHERIDSFIHIVAYFGLAVGIYVAMNRVRP